MIKKDIFEKVKEIEIKTKRVLSGFQSGDYRTKARGFGFDFDQLRDYVQGDDVRFIDWKSSARTGKTLVRQYLEDKNRSVYIMLDISGSTFFAEKKEIIFEIGAILALSGFYNKDNVGLILFSDKIIKFIPARSSRQHVLRILEEIFACETENQHQYQHTDISQIAKEALGRIKNNSIIFLISDFWDHNFYDPLKILSRHHDLIIISCHSYLEKNLPNVGILEFQDLESSYKTALNLNSYKAKQTSIFLKKFQEDFIKFCKQNSIDALEVNDNKSIINKLVSLFQRRVKI